MSATPTIQPPSARTSAEGASPLPGGGVQRASSARGERRGQRPWLKRWLLAIHGVLGLGTGLFLLATAGSGLLLMWTDELNLRGREAIAPGPLGPIEQGLPALAEQFPGYALTSIRANPDPGRAWTIFLRHPETNHRIASQLDPVTGAITANPDYSQTPFRWLLDLHYTFFLGATGQVIATVTAASLGLLAITGLWLYHPAIRELFRWRWDGRRPAPSLVWLHRWAGIWACLLALVWGVTGVIFMWNILPNTFSSGERRFVAADPTLLARLAPLAPMVAEARAALPGGELLNIIPPRPGAREVRLLFLFRDNLPWDKHGEARFHAFTGALRSVTPPTERSAEQRFDSAVAALHYGNMGGWGWTLLYFLGGLFLFTLPITGAFTWWHKQRSKRRERGDRTLS